MRSRMHPKYYLSQEIFDREQRKIFRKAWVFAGIKTLLRKNNAFITRKIAGIPVVIQNFQGELRAFENICLHRSAPLQTMPIGSRPLVCPYHGWKYNAQGCVANIPQCTEIYRFDEQEKASMHLREFALRAVGNLLFITLDDDPFPLEDQFSPELIASLEASSSHYDHEVMVTAWRCRFNWKLVAENLADPNHVRFLHSKDFSSYIKYDIRVNEAACKESEQPITALDPASLRREMCRFSYGGAVAEIPGMRRVPWWQSKIDRYGNQDVYYHWQVMPGLHIASGNGGHSFTIENYVPVSPGETDLELYWVMARKKEPLEAAQQVLYANMLGSRKIVGEDVDMLEKIQATLHLEAPVPNQGSYESFNRLVERWYTTLMETEHGI